MLTPLSAPRLSSRLSLYYSSGLSPPTIHFHSATASHSLQVRRAACITDWQHYNIITQYYSNIYPPGLLLNANWSIVSDMTLYIVIPPRRGIASATQILVSHMFGDAFSPYLIGVMADSFKPLISPNTTVVTQEHFMRSEENQLTPEEYDLEFRALEYSLFSCCFFQVNINQKSTNELPLYLLTIFLRLWELSSSSWCPGTSSATN